MTCQQKYDEIIKNLIYKNKVVIFGYSKDDYTLKASDFFKKEFKYSDVNTLVLLDKINESEGIVECLKKRSKTNKAPMVYLNGMFIGGWRSVENMHYRRDFDVFF
jgi:glutaredoxin-related protein